MGDKYLRYTLYISRHTKSDLEYLRKNDFNISEAFRELIRKKTDKIMRKNGELE